MKGLPKVLLVEDTSSLALVYREYLKDERLELTHVATGKAAIEAIAGAPPHLVLLDLKLRHGRPGDSALDQGRGIPFRRGGHHRPWFGGCGGGCDARRAQDFLEKPFDAARLRTTVRNVLEKVRLRDLLDDLRERDRYHGFIGSSLPMQAVYRIIDAAAPSKATVFITGESGTGKEVCAEAIHRQGPRINKPFIALNCGAIPHDLMESEIFGHVKGAFTGAYSEREGAASQADGGTLFLDEIGEMDLDLQTKLLRFVQTGRFSKVGGGKEKAVDVRFICATNRDPLAEVAAGRFREDLFYRLHVVPIHLPPLRDRGDDILSIARHFLIAYAGEEGKGFQDFTPEVELIFRKYAWPGNVRQLQNVIRNIVVLHDGDHVGRTHLPPPLDGALSEGDMAHIAIATQSGASRAHPRNEAILPLAQVERDAIERAIALCNGNIPKAAALLEVSPSTLYRKKQSWETVAI